MLLPLLSFLPQRPRCTQVLCGLVVLTVGCSIGIPVARAPDLCFFSQPYATRLHIIGFYRSVMIIVFANYESQFNLAGAFQTSQLAADWTSAVRLACCSTTLGVCQLLAL